MDYTPGAMVNANQQDFRVVDERPMSQGTRCQQLAMYVVYYAPLQMMADAPTAYLAEPDVLKFLAVVPTTWDETVPLDGEIGEYAVVARRKGDIWYVGGLTNWDARNLDVSLSFLGEGNYTLELYADGPNAHRLGEDYQLSSRTDVKFSNNLPVQLAPGGGFVAILKPAP
jgi:alpha-glucosidase